MEGLAPIPGYMSPPFEATNYEFRVKKRKIEGFVNYYNNSGVERYCVGYMYRSRNDADEKADATTRIACVRVEFEEGEGL